MARSNLGATAPWAASSADQAGERLLPALVIARCKSQPHHAGRVAHFPVGEVRCVGRGDDAAPDRFARFIFQRPGEVPTADSVGSYLLGDSISRYQFNVRSTGDALEIENTGRCPMFVNGQACERATLRPGDTVLLESEVVLICVLRPRVLPALRFPYPLHAFGEPDAFGIVGESAPVWQLRAELAEAATTEDQVLITGESGTGKELSASVVHKLSARARGPYVPHNAATFTATLLESELFGNAVNYPNHGMPARKGLLASAEHGTLFLDEIGDCPEDAQAQLLRALESGEYKPLGESVARRVDVRIVGATNRADSKFRDDFRRRFLARVRVPPLRERREDIPLLVRHFLLKRAEKHPEIRERFFRKGENGRLEPRISGRVIEHLLRQPLLGNARELHAFVRSSIAASAGNKLQMPPDELCSTSGEVSDGEPESHASGKPGSPSKADIVAHLKREDGNVTRVARLLGLSRAALYRLMESYGIKR